MADPKTHRVTVTIEATAAPGSLLGSCKTGHDVLTLATLVPVLSTAAATDHFMDIKRIDVQREPLTWPYMDAKTFWDNTTEWVSTGGSHHLIAEMSLDHIANVIHALLNNTYPGITKTLLEPVTVTPLFCALRCQLTDAAFGLRPSE